MKNALGRYLHSKTEEARTTSSFVIRFEAILYFLFLYFYINFFLSSFAERELVEITLRFCVSVVVSRDRFSLWFCTSSGRGLFFLRGTILRRRVLLSRVC
jgi:hypothetical protein